MTSVTARRTFVELMSADLPHLIGKLYDAALEPNAWQSVVHTMVALVGATSGHIYVHDMARGSAYGVAAENIDPTEIDRFNELFVEAPPCFAALQRADVGHISVENCRTDVMYNEFLRPMGVRHVLAAKLLDLDGRVWVFGAGRSEHASPFGSSEEERLAALRPHLERALTMQARLEAANVQVRASEAALDQMGQGIFLLDPFGRVTVANRLAEALVAQRDGLCLSCDGRLRGARSEDSAELGKAVALAVGTPPRGSTLALRRPSGKRELAVRVLPLSAEQEAFTVQAARALVMVTDPEDSRPDPLATTAQLYKLTKMETAVAAGLLAGKTPREIAEMRDLSLATVRTHLRSLYARTRTRGQGDLIALVLRS